MESEDSIEKKAISFVIKYEKGNNRHPVDVQKNRDFRGFDLFSFSDDKKDIRTIEVKGTRKEYSIPDLYETEVSREKRLIATHLYVVSFFNPNNPSLFIIPSKDILPSHLKEKLGYRISGTFKNRSMLKYRVKLNSTF